SVSQERYFNCRVCKSSRRRGDGINQGNNRGSEVAFATDPDDFLCIYLRGVAISIRERRRCNCPFNHWLDGIWWHAGRDITCHFYCARAICNDHKACLWQEEIGRVEKKGVSF